jgi:hypothetical protein
MGVGEGEGVNRDDVAQMMQDAAGADWGTEAHFQRFAALVAAAEREACLSILRDMEGRKWHLAMHCEEIKGVSLHDAYKAICARGKA